MQRGKKKLSAFAHQDSELSDQSSSYSLNSSIKGETQNLLELQKNLKVLLVNDEPMQLVMLQTLFV
jgi:hypothetical protein